jgi:hypothetical protein
MKIAPILFTGADLAKANALIAASALPASSTPLIMEGGCAQVTVSNNRVLADATTSPGCTPPPFLCTAGTCESTVVFAPIDTLNSVTTYPGRNDVLVVAYGDSLSVIELNPLQPQFFAPLIRGVAPRAVVWDSSSIAVTDAGRTYKLSF